VNLGVAATARAAVADRTAAGSTVVEVEPGTVVDVVLDDVGVVDDVVLDVVLVDEVVVVEVVVVVDVGGGQPSVVKRQLVGVTGRRSASRRAAVTATS
jgi:hypothetical protein